MKKIIWILLTLLVLVGIAMLIKTKTPDQYTYVITETGMASSFDPLDADQTLNMPVARMIYTTPIEVDQKGDLKSLILDTFEYDENHQIMTWKVKSGIKFTDSTEITPQDVAFSVARMAFTRPTFPVVEDISGLKEWLKEKSPLESLPSGIQIENKIIKIKFDKKQDHPLFRFCLEIFSIVPKACVDSSTNKITCKEIPGSGHYRLTEKSATELHFEKRDQNVVFGEAVPGKITFKYQTPVQVIEAVTSLDSKTIIAGSELRYSLDEMKQISERAVVSFAPASRIVGVVLNPNVGAFKDLKCRQVFAKAFRDAFRNLVGDARESESSIFTDLLPGYISKSDLQNTIASGLSADDIVRCKSKLQEEPIKWLKATNNQKSLFVQVMEKVFTELGIEKSEPVVMETQKDEVDLFVNNKLSISGFQTGFWAFDPAGDIQMLMTPNMHKSLKFVGEDQKMQELIRKLKSSGLQNSAFTELNKHIYQESLFNVFSHVRRFFVVKDKKILQEAPVSITSPAPWQFFKVE